MNKRFLDRVEIVTDDVQKKEIVVVRPDTITDELIAGLVEQNPIGEGYLCLRSIGNGEFTPAIKEKFVDSFGIALQLNTAMIAVDIKMGKELYMRLNNAYKGD